VRSNLTITSVPPVVAPVLKTSPTPVPTKTAPQTAARRRLSVSGPISALTPSTASEETKTAYIVDARNLNPNFIVPIKRMGTLISAMTVPVGSISINFVIIIATPDTPPDAILLGSRKQEIPVAKINAPSVRTKISLISFLFFNLLFYSTTHLVF